MICYRHTERPASGACTACGEMICEECSVKIQNRRQCKPCIENAHRHPTAMTAGGSAMPVPYGSQPLAPHGAYPPPPPPPPMVFNISGGASSSASASSAPIVVVQRRPFNHTLHLILTVFTLGMWLPIWIVAALLHRD
jgi:hypothetical protein